MTASDPTAQAFRAGNGLPRVLEVPVALLALIVLSPVLLVLALLIKSTSSGPVLFRQRRVGQHGDGFTLLKLRSMRTTPALATTPIESPSGNAITATGDPRVTAIGKVLRRTKIDELPELWNVARGEMSLVGPRPEVPQYVDLDDPLWRQALSVRPGLTDPATLELRGEEAVLALVAGDRSEIYRTRLLPFKLRRSVAYLKRRSWWTDLGVLAQTALALILPRRQSAEELLRRILEEDASRDST